MNNRAYDEEKAVNQIREAQKKMSSPDKYTEGPYPDSRNLCDTQTQTAVPGKSVRPDGGGIATVVRQRLYDERARLRNEIDRIQHAISLAEGDDGVCKVLEVLSAAKI